MLFSNGEAVKTNVLEGLRITQYSGFAEARSMKKKILKPKA